MTRYTLIDEKPVEVKYIKSPGLYIANPSDEYIDEHQLGYPKDETPPEIPTHESETHKLEYSWTVQDGVIKKAITVVPRTLQERLQEVVRELSGLDADYTSFIDSPLAYTDGHLYKPSWASMYYAITLQIGTFPRGIANCDTLTPTIMTLEQLQALCVFLSNAVETKLAEYQANMGTLLYKKAQIEQLIAAERAEQSPIS